MGGSIMSAVAGRVLLKFRGNYNSATEYDPLDVVFSNSSTYVCTNETVGHDPTDTNYWQILAQGAGDVIPGAFFGTCNSSGETQNKVVTINNADNFVLKRGVIIGVQFSATNTFVATSSLHVTLNVNGSGVYSIYFGDTDSPEGTNKVAFGEADYVNYYQFDGLHWVYLSRSGFQTAEETPYDNTSSGLTADNVNDAIDETLDYAEDNISAIVNVLGSKNLNSYPYYETTKSHRGIVFTDIGDGRIKLGGDSAQTASGGTAIFVCHSRNSSNPNPCILPNGKYTFNGCPEGGSANTYYAEISISDENNSNLIIGTDVGDGCSFTINGDYYSDDKAYIQIRMCVALGTTIPAGGLMFEPIIVPEGVTDTSWKPWAMTNKELTDRIANKLIYIIFNVENLTPNVENDIRINTYDQRANDAIGFIPIGANPFTTWNTFLLFMGYNKNTTDLSVKVMGTDSQNYAISGYLIME